MTEQLLRENAELRDAARAFLESIAGVEGLSAEAKELEIRLWKLVEPIVFVNCTFCSNVPEK